MRISVIGNSGTGKSTLARRISRILDVPLLELDSIYHQKDWKPLDAEDFRARARAFVASDRWVVDGNYRTHGVAEIVWSAADAILWLDPSRAVVMRQIVLRTLRRLLSGEELWNGNRESLRNLASLRPEDNVIVWAWTRHAHYRELYGELSRGQSWAHARVHRLRSRQEVESYLATLRDTSVEASMARA